MLRHVQKLCEYKGEYVGMREARKHAGWYFKGMRDAASLRRKAGSIEKFDDLVELCKSIEM